MRSRRRPLGVEWCHSDIAQVYGFENNAIAMELVDGPTLPDRLTPGPIHAASLLPRTSPLRVNGPFRPPSVIAWENTGFRKVCGPFVAFTPEPGMKYVVVNERIGGKGMSALWTGMARQTCRVSVYRQADNGFASVPTRPVGQDECRVS